MMARLEVDSGGNWGTMGEVVRSGDMLGRERGRAKGTGDELG